MSRLNNTYTAAAIVSAMPEELEYAHEYLAGRKGWKRLEESVYENSELGLYVITQIMGVGKVNAAYQTADVINEYDPDLIINVGYAGGLTRAAHRGDVAVGTEYVQVDFIPFFDKNRPKIAPSPPELTEKLEKEAKELDIPVYKGKIATGDFFLHSTEQKNRIIKEFDPIAFDMESAAVAQVAAQKNVPFIALRTFSDLADDHAVETVTAERNSDTSIPIERRPIVLALNTLEKHRELL